MFFIHLPVCEHNQEHAYMHTHVLTLSLCTSRLSAFSWEMQSLCWITFPCICFSCLSNLFIWEQQSMRTAKSRLAINGAASIVLHHASSWPDCPHLLCSSLPVWLLMAVGL